MLAKLNTPDGSESYAVAMRRKAQAGGGLILSRVMLPELIGPDGRVNRTPEAMAGAETLRLDAALVRASRVAQAGAHIVIVPEQDTARADLPKPAFRCCAARNPSFA